MQQLFILRKMIQGNAQKGNSSNIENMYQHNSEQNKQNGRPEFSGESNDKSNKQNHNTYGITTFNDSGNIFIVVK